MSFVKDATTDECSRGAKRELHYLVDETLRVRLVRHDLQNTMTVLPRTFIERLFVQIRKVRRMRTQL